MWCVDCLLCSEEKVVTKVEVEPEPAPVPVMVRIAKPKVKEYDEEVRTTAMHSVTTWCGIDTHAIYCVKLHGDVVEQSLNKEINDSEAFQPRGSVTKQCHHLLTVISRICHPITMHENHVLCLGLLCRDGFHFTVSDLLIIYSNPWPSSLGASPEAPLSVAQGCVCTCVLATYVQ